MTVGAWEFQKSPAVYLHLSNIRVLIKPIFVAHLCHALIQETGGLEFINRDAPT